MNEDNNLPPNNGVRANLPARLPSASLVLNRTQSTLGLLQDVIQESSAEYWNDRGKTAVAREAWEEAISCFQNGLLRRGNHNAIFSLENDLRNSIDIVCQTLKQKKLDEKYYCGRPYKYGNGGYKVFNEYLWSDDNEHMSEVLIRLFDCLSQIHDSVSLKSQIWIEAAKIFTGLIFQHPKRASDCYRKSYAFENKLETYISECSQCGYSQTWPDGRSIERIMSLNDAISKYPNYYLTYWSRGERRVAAKNYLEAADDFEEYFRLGGPEIRWRYQILAETYFKLNNRERLESALAHVSSLGGSMMVIDNELKDLYEDEL